VRRVLAGLGLGLLLGALARGWMHLLATEPGVTWSGTGFVLGVFAVAGLGTGAVAEARHGGRSRWWRLAALLAVPMFLGPGMVLAPAFVVGGWGMHRGPAARAAAAAAVLAAPLFLVASAWDEVQRTLLPYPDAGYLLVVGLGATALAAALGWAGASALGPWGPRSAAATYGLARPALCRS